MLRRHLYGRGKVKSPSLFLREHRMWSSVGRTLLFTTLTLLRTFQLVRYIGDPTWPTNAQGVIQLMSARYL